MSPVDWVALRRRVDRAHAGIAELLEPSPESARAIMDERARRLADAGARQVEPTQVLETLGFGLGVERYAVESKHVREVVRLVDFTPVPGAPEFLLGITNLRGQVLVLADLRKFFGLRQQGLSDLARVVVVGTDRPELGILADEAHELRSIPVTEIQDPPESMSGIGSEYLLGVTKDALIVLDGARLLTDPRLFVGPTESSETREIGE
jgi:purine-binding chemotaxis protein CheW